MRQTYVCVYLILADAGYHELKMVPGSGLPSLTRIKKERKRQNAEIRIEPVQAVIIINS